MPDKIWILNIDDFVFKTNAVDVITNHSLKYIQILKPNDLCVVSPMARRDDVFVSYMAKIKKLANKEWMFLPKKHNPQDSFVQAIMKDKRLVAKLKALCKKNYVIIPLMYTKDFAKLSRMCGNHLLNNSIAVQEANNKLVFKKLCKEFGIETIKPVFEYKGKNRRKILSYLSFTETYLLRKPVSAGGYGNTKGKLLDLLKIIASSTEGGHYYIERFKDIYKTLGSLCTLKENSIQFIGIDSQIINKAAWEGCEFPFNKIDKNILAEIKKHSLSLAQYFHKKGVRGQINFDWAVTFKNGVLKVRALECNSRYNGFGLCIRLANTVYGIPKEKLHFYLDTKISFSRKLNTAKVIAIISKINKNCGFTGGVMLTTGVREGTAGFCFAATSKTNIAKLRSSFKKHILAVK